MKFAEAMDMAASYKPVLLLAMLQLADERGRARVSDLVFAFKQFYLNRIAIGLPPEKPKARMSQVETMTDLEVERLVFAMPFERFERHGFFVRPKEVEFVAFAPEVWRRLSDEDKGQLRETAQSCLKTYFDR
ncbi:MAG: hypothetical protein EPO21_17880 [Chloroflexota bacterium]|nr:MAG: hypothetical protein EPO21_17880 [Chloroflexota bacterium]